jgi:hypothetical protein
MIKIPSWRRTLLYKISYSQSKTFLRCRSFNQTSNQKAHSYSSGRTCRACSVSGAGKSPLRFAQIMSKIHKREA